MSESRAVTISDVAERAGVAKATVSMVMRNKAGISDATRQRVLGIARHMNYRPSTVRQTRGSVHHGHISFLAISKATPRVGRRPGGSYLHSMLDGCHDQAQGRGWVTSIVKATLDDLRAGRSPVTLERGQFDGLLVRGPFIEEVGELLDRFDIPKVLIDCDRHVPGACQVQIENLQAMEQIAEHLIAQGSRRIATITGEMEHLNAQERLAGLQMALARRGYDLDPQLIVYEQGFDEASGERGIKELLSRNKPFDAVVCHNDLIAMAAMRVLLESGRRIPHDVRICGFDDMEFSQLLPMPLTTVDACPYEVGQVGARLLLEMIEPGESHSVNLRQPTRLVVRESTALDPPDGVNR